MSTNNVYSLGTGVPKNGTIKGVKKTPKNQAHPTYQLRDGLTDDKFKGFKEEYPITELVELRSSLPRGQKDKSKIKNPKQSLPYPLPSLERDRSQVKP